MGMETRMERYAKYREQIKHMAPEQFVSAKKVGANQDETEESLANLSLADEVANAESKVNSGPYSLYLKRRRRFLIAKIVALVLVVVAFVVWWFLLQGRK